LSGGALSCVHRPWWGTTWLGWYVQFFGTLSVSRADSGESAPILHWQRLQPSHFSGVLNEPCLQPCRVPYNVLIARQTNICDIFNGFKSLKTWEWDFLQLEGATTATWFYLTPHTMLTLWQTRANCLGTSTEGTIVQKQPSLQPSHLTVSSFRQHECGNRTYGRTMYSTHINPALPHKETHKMCLSIN